jgi:6-pyruvoyltetrahydropterin/6-carboxytetrahydropterin synthase
MGTYTVRVDPEHLRFSCAHWLLFSGSECEAVHGHNYRASVELTGPLQPVGYVFDFVTLKRVARAICDRLSHHVLLPAENEALRVRRVGATLEATHHDRRYAFPADDVIMLPVRNTTAELIAHWFAGEVRRELRATHQVDHVARIRVGIEEAPGQAAFVDEEF